MSECTQTNWYEMNEDNWCQFSLSWDIFELTKRGEKISLIMTLWTWRLV